MRTTPQLLTGCRVALRFPEPRDTECVHRIYTDPEVIPWLDGLAHTSLKESQAFIVNSQSDWLFPEARRWTVERLADHEPIGLAMIRFHNDAVEIGYVFQRSVWGSGYATEACRLVLDWFASEPTLTRLFAPVSRNNFRSIAVLSRLGLRTTGRLFSTDQEGEMVEYEYRKDVQPTN